VVGAPAEDAALESPDAESAGAAEDSAAPDDGAAAEVGLVVAFEAPADFELL